MRSKKIIYNIFSSILLQIISIICGFIIPKLIISSYGSNVNGLISSITQLLAFITLLEAGFGPVIKSCLYKPISNKDTKTIIKILKSSENIFRKISYIFILYIIVLCIFLPIKLTNQFDNLYTLSLIIIISISTFFEYYLGMVYKLYLQTEQKTYVISYIQIITLIVNTVVVCILVHFNQSIQLVKLVSTLIFVLRPFMQKEYVKKKYGINLKKEINNYKINQKWDGLAQHIAYIAHNNADIVILTLFGNLGQVSVYSIYSMIVNTLRNVVQSFVGGLDAYFGTVIAEKNHKALNNGFKIYEYFYFTISTVLFLCALFLIIPFIKIYTKNITDVNYVEPLFAYLLVIAKFFQVIRQPYNDLVKVSGHFKQTKKGAIIEASSNIVISIILVFKYGLVGVAIGTLFAMIIRTIEFMYYTSKNILKRNVFESFKNLLLILIEFIIVYLVIKYIPKINIYSYYTWILEAIIEFIISLIVVTIINTIVYKDTVKSLLNKIKKLKKEN